VIAAALSGDQALLNAVSSGDVSAFAKMAGLVPPDATKIAQGDSGPVQACVLGTNWHAGPSLALRTGLSVIEAQDLPSAGPDVPGVHRVGRACHRRGQLAGYCRGLRLDAADRGTHTAGDSTAELSHAGQRSRDAAWRAVWPPTGRRGLRPSATRCSSRATPIGGRHIGGHQDRDG
jgi:hypothetical protein